MTASRLRAMLLLGPTSAGKTPLGDMIASRGLWGASCSHFDFGQRLRQIADGRLKIETLGESDIEFITDVLKSSALLEDDMFYIAEAILRDFISALDIQDIQDSQDMIILNGLPRHVGQARLVGEIVDIQIVCQLRCDAATVRSRICQNSGGDRAGRLDDDDDAVKAKLEIYRQRIAPLVEFYRNEGAKIKTLPIAAETTADDLWQQLNESRFFNTNSSQPC